MSIGDSLKQVQGQILATGKTVHLIAVSKTQALEAIREAAACGQRLFGENYVQELVRKAETLAKEGYQPQSGVEGEAPAALPMEGATLAPKINWHFIGHLQRNKVAMLLPWASTIHSIDSIELAEAIAKRATKRIAGFVEVNVGFEASKTGIDPAALPELLRACSHFQNLEIKGLMCIPPPTNSPEDQKKFFMSVAQLQDRANAELWYKTPLTDLSMGMSHDFLAAIECGATYVRVGTMIFGKRP